MGRICAPVSLFIPAYLILVMSGWKGLKSVFPAAAACGITFAGTQFLVSNYIGPELTDILASLAAMGALLIVIRGEGSEEAAVQIYDRAKSCMAWAPYALLVVFVLLWGAKTPFKAWLASTDIPIQWPGLHNVVQRMPPVVAAPAAVRRRVPLPLAFRRRDVVFVRRDSGLVRSRHEARAVFGMCSAKRRSNSLSRS